MRSLIDVRASQPATSWLDLTAGVAPSYGFPDSVEPSQALARLAADPEALARVTVSSDANGSAIFRDDAGCISAVIPQRVAHLWQQVRAAILVILLDEHLGVRDVYARGRELVHDGELVERGVFDS